MIDSFLATLEARAPSLGRMRSYRLKAGTDLLGAWLVDVVYGRMAPAAGAFVMWCTAYDRGNIVEDSGNYPCFTAAV